MKLSPAQNKSVGITLCVLAIIAVFVFAIMVSGPHPHKAVSTPALVAVASAPALSPEAKLDSLKTELTLLDIDKDSDGVLTRARTDEVCSSMKAYDEYQKLEQEAYEAKIPESTPGYREFEEKQLAGTMKVLKNSVLFGYQVLKNGKSLGCGEDEAFTIENLAVMMDTHQPWGKSIDPQVVRKAYLQAVRNNVKKDLEGLVGSPDGPDHFGALRNDTLNARTKWHFTCDELGIPPNIAQKIQ